MAILKLSVQPTRVGDATGNSKLLHRFVYKAMTVMTVVHLPVKRKTAALNIEGSANGAQGIIASARIPVVTLTVTVSSTSVFAPAKQAVF